MSGVFFCDKCSNLYDIGQDKNGNDIFICNSCGDSKKIESGTLFLSKGESINDNVNVNKKKEAKALMHTSNYICPNKDCPSHKKGSKKDMIVEYDKLNSYRRRMICLICNTKWM